jgi:hypothetical protein
MRNKQSSAILGGRKPAVPIKTTLMDLLRELTRVTEDDTQVMAMVKNIFASHKVRLSRSLAPVRLVNSKTSARAARRAGLGRKSAAWA